MYFRQFYSELGKLLYAIASIDGVISPKEKEMLKTLVRKELVPGETHTDTFGTDAAYYVDIEFDILEETGMDAGAAFDSFIDFMEAHPSAIDKRMRDMALKTARQVANAWRKTNPKEKKIIEQLERKLQGIPLPQH